MHRTHIANFKATPDCIGACHLMSKLHLALNLCALYYKFVVSYWIVIAACSFTGMWLRLYSHALPLYACCLFNTTAGISWLWARYKLPLYTFFAEFKEASQSYHYMYKNYHWTCNFERGTTCESLWGFFAEFKDSSQSYHYTYNYYHWTCNFKLLRPHEVFTMILCRI